MFVGDKFMGDTYEEYGGEVVEGLCRKVENEPFKIEELKLEYFYFDSGEKDNVLPISTSVELTSKYDFNLQRDIWTKRTVHRFRGLNGTVDEEVLSEELKDDSLIQRLEKYDLRDLKNNYFSESKPERYSRWELSYNYLFKIVGSGDIVIEEYKELSDLLGLYEACQKEIADAKRKYEMEQAGEKA